MYDALKECIVENNPFIFELNYQVKYFKNSSNSFQITSNEKRHINTEDSCFQSDFVYFQRLFHSYTTFVITKMVTWNTCSGIDPV